MSSGGDLQHDKARDVATQMVLQQHARWYQWSIFFFGSIASVFTISYQSKLIPPWLVCFISAILSAVWTVVAQNIRVQTRSWYDTVNAIEKGETSNVFKTYETILESKNEERMSDFMESLRMWKPEFNLSVTRILVCMGALFTVGFLILAGLALGASAEWGEELLLAILVPVIGLLSAYIAWREYCTSRDKLKLDLYDRRFKVYEGLIGLISAIVNGRNITDALGIYYEETHEGRFLFNDDIIEYMKEVRTKAVELRSKREQADAIPDTSANEIKREKIVNEVVDLETWFDKQDEEIAPKFQKYLGFKKNL